MQSVHPLKVYASPPVVHATALAVPSDPLAQVHPETEKLLGVKSTSFLLVLSYPDVKVGVGHTDSVHKTPTGGEEEVVQTLPVPKEAVHGLFPEQATILEESPFMSIVDSELIMVAEVAEESM